MSSSEKSDFTEVNELNGNVIQDKVRKGWVKFEDESPKTAENETLPSVLPPAGASTSAPTESAAVLKTETVHINLERGDKNVEPISLGTLSKNVEFVNVRQGFCKYHACDQNIITAVRFRRLTYKSLSLQLMVTLLSLYCL